jgi:hypothetical protein
MYSAARLALAAGLLLTAVLAVWGLIRMRGRLRSRLEEMPLSLLKEPDALYRNGLIIARVEGAMVDEAARWVHFEWLTGTVNLLNLGPDVLDFRHYRLRCHAIESMSGTPPYRYHGVTCNIVGQT